MPAAAAAALCSRVTTTSVIMRARPPPSGSPTGSAYASCSPTSAVGTARVPSLSLSRCSVTPRAAESGAVVKPDSGESAAYRGMRNGARARLPPRPGVAGLTSAIAMAESMAEQNHFSPVTRHDPSAAGDSGGGGPADVGTALRLGHPLSTGDSRRRVGRDEPGQPGIPDGWVHIGA